MGQMVFVAKYAGQHIVVPSDQLEQVLQTPINYVLARPKVRDGLL